MTRQSGPVPHKQSNLAGLVFERVSLAGARVTTMRWFSKYSLSVESNILRRMVGNVEADLYVGHNIGALPILSELKNKFGGLAIYDNMEVYSDMDGQSNSEKERIRRIERAFIPNCDLVLTTSPLMRDFMIREYGLGKCSYAYNCPPVAQEPGTKMKGFHLYWRNTVIGLGNRGLDDVLRALALLPKDVVLHLQGRCEKQTDDVRRLISSLGISERVQFLDPYQPEQAVAMAAPYSVGLCLERDTCKNHRLTASNKIFDYHMAGLAVVCSDMPALRQIVQESCGGFTFKNADPNDLCGTILKLYSNRKLLVEKQKNARRFATRYGHEDHQMNEFIEEVDTLVTI
jgi:glycosyltransferase involved in cell wall biosynthesis